MQPVVAIAASKKGFLVDWSRRLASPPTCVGRLFKKKAFTPSTLFSAEPRWQNDVAWFESGGC